MKHDPAPLAGARRARARIAMPLARTLGPVFLLLAAAPPALAQAMLSVVATDDLAAESPPDGGAFAVRRVGGDLDAPVTVTYSVTGTATPGADYAALSGSLTLGAGQSEMAIPVSVSGDDGLLEGDETVTVTLLESDAVDVVDATATVIIRDTSGADGGDGDDGGDGGDDGGDDGDDGGDDGDGDDGGDGGDDGDDGDDGGDDGGDGDGDDDGDDGDSAVAVSIVATDASAVEGSSDRGVLVVRRVGGDPDRDVTVDYSVGGSATPHDDYKALSGRVDLKPGELEAAITVDPGKDDGLLEGDETVTVTLAAREGEVVVVGGAASVTIHDAAPTARTVSVSTSANAAEPATAGRVTVTLDAADASAGALTVQYSVGGTATAGVDYATLSGAVQIGAGASSATIEIIPIDDAVDEADETVVVTLGGTSLSGVTVGSPSTATVTIVDNETDGGVDDGDGDDGSDDGDDGDDGDGDDGGDDVDDGDDATADDDGDGLSNGEEQEHGTDPQAADSDGDGAGDRSEIDAGTDPLDERSFADIDGDLVPDAVESGDGTDPGDATSFADGDGGSTADHIETVTYPSFGLPPTNVADAADDRRDFDDDGLPDRLEIGAGSNAASADSPTAGGAGDNDGNGITNAVQAYLGTLAITTVDEVSDRDRDGYPDAAEVSLGLDPLRATERDSDADGVPDVVEALAGINVDAGTDSDGDGVPDAREIALGTNTLDANSPVANGAMDDDGDGVSNAIEEVLRVLGAVDDATADGDGDGDGITDADEIRFGADPQHDEQPAAWIELTQSELGGVNALSPAGGTATARALVGGHQAGTFAYDWSGSSDAILAVSSGTQSAGTIAFEPQTLPPGPYTLSVVVRRNVGDYSSPPTTVTFTFVALEDGAAGEIADADHDGVPDSADGADAHAGLAHELEAGPGGRMQAEPGLRLQLGTTARAARTSEARVTLEDIANAGDGNGGSVENGADEFEYPGGIYDFEVTNLPEVGAAVHVVIPLAMGIGEVAEYRKFQPERGWGAFVEDENNAIASAGGGVCPPPGDESYEPGLTPGHLCVQLTIQDGGPNDGDADLGPNGVVKDPGGVATTAGAVTVGQGSGSIDPLWLILLAALGYRAALLRRPCTQRRTPTV